ncbi:sodium-coupled monocarboxylate transporter 2-like isoform X1 [Amblyomma americanum]
MQANGPSAQSCDYVVFGCLTTLSLGIGLYLSLRRRSGLRSKDETFLGSRTIRTLPLALSMCASNVTASGLIAFTAHYYLYGFHTLWAIPAFVPAVLIVAFLFLPVLYELKVTSIFEYLRMRYGNGVGVASSVIYFGLSQAIGVTGLYSAAVAMSTMFGLSPVATTIALGTAGTIYTALGGLRCVVWADCVQALIMTSAPLIIIVKVVYDSSQSVHSLRSMDDFDIKANFFRTDMDVTTDETVWAALFAAFPYQLLRLGLDQMITQRFLAARSLREARIVTFAGAGLLSVFYALSGLTALAIVYWYRDCDPVISGSISRYDQIVPYYINKSTSAIDGVRGLFMAGVVSASISTVSSIVNSHAAVLFVDIVSPNFHVSEKKSPLVVAALAAASGMVMTLLGLLVPYAGSAARFCISLYSAASGPFTGIVILAFLFPWANTKGTATAALGVFIIQICQMTGRFLSRIEPLRMNYSLERCPLNSTVGEATPSETIVGSQDAFLLYRLSPYWCCLLSAFSTVVLGLTFSLLCGKRDDSTEHALRLSNPAMLRFWRRIGLLRHLPLEDGYVAVIGRRYEESPFQPPPKQEKEADLSTNLKATKMHSPDHEPKTLLT